MTEGTAANHSACDFNANHTDPFLPAARTVRPVQLPETMQTSAQKNQTHLLVT